jgi:hypothetical protein
VLGNGPGAASILVTPEVATLTSLGATQQYTATAIDANGNVLTGVVFQWASSNGAVASVNATGLATALAAGATAISASANGVTGVAVLSVSLPAGSTAVHYRVTRIGYPDGPWRHAAVHGHRVRFKGRHRA